MCSWNITECQTESGECKRIGAKWSGNNNCADFECVKRSETNVAIEVREKGGVSTYHINMFIIS